MAYANDTHVSHQGASLWQRLGELRADWAERAARYRTYRATLSELSQLSDRDLRDLGLSRHDIDAVARDAAYGA